MEFIRISCLLRISVMIAFSRQSIVTIGCRNRCFLYVCGKVLMRSAAGIDIICIFAASNLGKYGTENHRKGERKEGIT